MPRLRHRAASSSTSLLVSAAALIIILAGLQAAQTLVASLLVAAFLSILSYPLVSWLHRRHLPQLVAVLLVVLLDATVLAAIGLLLSGLVSDAMFEPEHLKRPLEETLLALSRWLARFGVVLRSAPGGALDTVSGMVDSAAVVSVVTGTLGGVATVLSHTVMITLTMIFVLLEAAVLPGKLGAALGEGRPELGALVRINAEVQRYLRLKTAINCVAGGLLAVFLALLDVHHPALWGLFAVLVNYVPSLGSLIVFAVVTVVSIAERGTAWGLAAGLGTIVIHTVVLSLVEPAWLGRRFGLSVLVVFLSLIFWGWILGPLGMLFAVPLTVVAKIGLENSPRHRWLAVLLEPGRSL